MMSFLANYLISTMLIYTIFGLARDQISRESKKEEFTHENIRLLSNIIIRQAIFDYITLVSYIVSAFLVYICFVKAENNFLAVTIIFSALISAYIVILLGVSM
ncbi:UNVERIFIED_CONTAM: hypothetical protein O8I53_05310 [Campylobacter lari]